LADEIPSLSTQEYSNEIEKSYLYFWDLCVVMAAFLAFAKRREMVVRNVAWTDVEV
jgi:hypothetical protein